MDGRVLSDQLSNLAEEDASGDGTDICVSVLGASRGVREQPVGGT
jgi:hypothetical protein